MIMFPVWALLRLKVFINTGKRKEIAFLSRRTNPQVSANKVTMLFWYVRFFLFYDLFLPCLN